MIIHLIAHPTDQLMFSFQHVELSSLWKDKTVVMFFLRRFGCQICRWAAAEVSKLEKDLRENGVALIGIGPEETGLQEFKDGGFFKGGEFKPCCTWKCRVSLIAESGNHFVTSG